MPCGTFEYLPRADPCPDPSAHRKEKDMPCSDGPRPGELERQVIDVLEQLLCSSCRVLRRLDYDFDENPMLSQWWEEHQKKDAERSVSEKK